MALNEKVAIVTGAAGGIGIACVERFVKEGARVMMSDLAVERDAQVTERLKVAGEGIAYRQCDVGDRGAVDALVAATVERFGRVDIMVSNAGITNSGQFLDVSENDFNRVVRVNLNGVFHCGQAAARQMVRQGAGGAIVNTASVASELAMPSEIAYAATKGGVRQLTKAMALSLAPHGIRVNAVGPGSIDTEMIRSLCEADPKLRRKILSRTPLGRLGKASEIAAVMLFLASDESSYITGQTLYADGGRLSLNFTVTEDGAGPSR